MNLVKPYALVASPPLSAIEWRNLYVGCTKLRETAKCSRQLEKRYW